MVSKFEEPFLPKGYKDFDEGEFQEKKILLKRMVQYKIQNSHTLDNIFNPKDKISRYSYYIFFASIHGRYMILGNSNFSLDGISMNSEDLKSYINPEESVPTLIFNFQDNQTTHTGSIYITVKDFDDPIGYKHFNNLFDACPRHSKGILSSDLVYNQFPPSF